MIGQSGLDGVGSRGAGGAAPFPVASQVGKTIVGGIDLNKARIRHVVEAPIALSPLPNGFIASDVAARLRALSKQSQSEYGPDMPPTI